MSKKRTFYLNRFLWVRLALLALMVFGVFLLYFQTAAFIMARQSKSWPRTQGVLSVEMGPYRKTLSYRYSVGGVRYTSDRVIFGELGDRVRSKEWTAVSDSPSGSELAVYYSPDNPKESVVFTELMTGSWFHFLLGGAFLLAGSIVTIILPRLKQVADDEYH